MEALKNATISQLEAELENRQENGGLMRVVRLCETCQRTVAEDGSPWCDECMDEIEAELDAYEVESSLLGLAQTSYQRLQG